MKKLLILLALSTLFCSCEPAAVKNGRKLYKDYFNYILKDPSSLIIYKEDYQVVKEVGVKWKVDYGAKNSFGAMNRETIEFETIGKDFIKVQREGEALPSIYFPKDFR